MSSHKSFQKLRLTLLFDSERFIEHAKEVMVYILANCRELFAKPYIVMFGEDLNMDCTCFVSVNAGSPIGDGGRYKEGGAKVRGFFNYDPMAEDDEFQNRAIKADDPYLFFLTLAHHVYLSYDDLTMDPLEEFNDITSFVHAFLDPAAVSFEERYDQEPEDFRGDQDFVQLALPKTYPLRLGPQVVHYSKLASIVFFIDLFCVSVAGAHDFRWAVDGTRGGINPKKPQNNNNKMKFCYAIPMDFPFG